MCSTRYFACSGNGVCCCLSTRQLSQNLIELIDLRQPAHHAALRQLSQHLEVQVPILGMPSPRVVTAPCGQAGRLCNAEDEHVEPVATAVYPRKYATLLAADREHTVLDEHLVAVLVELLEAHYVAA